MEVFKYILKNKLLLILLILLMTISISLTFVLPYWQAKIINIGLVQDGIEYAVPTKISEDTFNKINLLIDDNVELEKYYEKNDDADYNLNRYGRYNYSLLDQSLTNPLAYIAYAKNNNLNIQDNLYNDYCTNTEPGIIKQLALKKCKDEMQQLGVNIFNFQVQYILNQGAMMLLFVIISCIIGYCTGIINSKIALTIAYEKRNELFNNILDFSNAEINEFSEATLITRCTNDISVIQNFASMIMSTILSAPINIVMGFIFAYATAPQLSWIIIVAALSIFIASVISVKLLTPIFSIVQKLLDRINHVTRFLLSGVFTIKTWNQEELSKEKFKKANEPLFKRQLFIGKLLSIINPLLGLGTSIITIIILILGSIYIDLGDMQVGDLIAFISYSMIIISTFTSLGMFIGNLPRCNVSVQRIDEIINKTSSVKDINKKNNSNNIFYNLNSQNFNIQFKNVYYSFNNNSNYDINNIDLEINSGETLAIVGETGSGKTTLIQLLIRLLETSKGSILLNGNSIKNIPLKDYYNLFAYAPQESFLFSGSIKDNILYASNSSDNKQLLNKVIKEAQLENFVNNNKLDSAISQDSINISGGQKQRISIARALACQRPILVFDDCFTSLDYIIESKIINAIYNNYKKTTIIIASSRISNITNADKIICMFKGKIVGQGTFDQLMNTCPEFVKIVKSQKQSLENILGSDNN